MLNLIVIVIILYLFKKNHILEKFDLLPNIFTSGSDDTLRKIPPRLRSPGYWNIPWNKGTRILRNNYDIRNHMNPLFNGYGYGPGYGPRYGRRYGPGYESRYGPEYRRGYWY
jgi:hypothetical protein